MQRTVDADTQERLLQALSDVEAEALISIMWKFIPETVATEPAVIGWFPICCELIGASNVKVGCDVPVIPSTVPTRMPGCAWFASNVILDRLCANVRACEG